MNFATSVGDKSFLESLDLHDIKVICICYSITITVVITLLFRKISSNPCNRTLKDYNVYP